MIFILILILPLLEDEKRPSRPLGKVEWMTELCDSTSKFGRYARPPPATDFCKIRACQALQHITAEAWEST